MLTRKFMIFIFLVGVLSGLILLGYYLYLRNISMMNLPDARTLIFIALTLGTALTAFSMKDLRTPLYTIKFWTNKYLLGSFMFALFGLLLALKVEFFSTLLHLTNIDLVSNVLSLFTVILLNLISVEIVKYFSFE